MVSQWYLHICFSSLLLLLKRHFALQLFFCHKVLAKEMLWQAGLLALGIYGICLQKLFWWSLTPTWVDPLPLCEVWTLLVGRTDDFTQSLQMFRVFCCFSFLVSFSVVLVATLTHTKIPWFQHSSLEDPGSGCLECIFWRVCVGFFLMWLAWSE